VQGLLRDQPMVQADVGRADAQLRAARALLTETVRQTWDEVSTTGAISLDQRAALRIAATHAIRLSIVVIDTLYHAGGATSVYDGHFLQRAFQDIHVISQHVQSRRAHYELIGRYWLGLPTDGGRF
jgi:alkylation response protein AidB-like acyl-CoA dehydrogenase